MKPRNAIIMLTAILVISSLFLIYLFYKHNPAIIAEKAQLTEKKRAAKKHLQTR